MSESATALLSMAQEDLQIQRNQTRLGQIPTEKNKLRKAVNLIERELKKLQTELTNIDKQIKMRNSLIAIENEKIEEANKRMMAVTNQKEYSATQKEIDAAKRTVKKTEDQILELEEQKEPLETKVAELQQDFDKEDASYQEAAKHLIEEEETLSGQIAKAEAVITEQRNRVEQADLKKYDLLKSRNLMPPAVEVDGPFCLGCAMSIRPQIFNDLIREGSLDCPNCRRILFYKAPEEPEPTEKTKKK